MIVLSTDLTSSECEDRLRQTLAGDSVHSFFVTGLVGTVEDGTIRLTFNHVGRGGPRPIFEARIRPVPGGSRIEGRFTTQLGDRIVVLLALGIFVSGAVASLGRILSNEVAWTWTDVLMTLLVPVSFGAMIVLRAIWSRSVEDHIIGSVAAALDASPALPAGGAQLFSR